MPDRKPPRGPKFVKITKYQDGDEVLPRENVDFIGFVRGTNRVIVELRTEADEPASADSRRQATRNGTRWTARLNTGNHASGEKLLLHVYLAGTELSDSIHLKVQ